MKQYIYSGPLSGVSLKGHKDVMLVPGSTVKLPEKAVYTERLIRKGWLHEVAEPVVVAETEIEKPKRRKS